MKNEESISLFYFFITSKFPVCVLIAFYLSNFFILQEASPTKFRLRLFTFSVSDNKRKIVVDDPRDGCRSRIGYHKRHESAPNAAVVR